MISPLALANVPVGRTSASLALLASAVAQTRLFNRCDLCRCDLCRLTLVRRQDAAQGHANYKHHGKHHSYYAVISWRAKPSHLLVQKFLVASIHFKSPIFVRAKRDKTAAVPLIVAEQIVGSLFQGATLAQ